MQIPIHIRSASLNFLDTAIAESTLSVLQTTKNWIVTLWWTTDPRYWKQWCIVVTVQGWNQEEHGTSLQVLAERGIDKCEINNKMVRGDGKPGLAKD